MMRSVFLPKNDPSLLFCANPFSDDTWSQQVRSAVTSPTRRYIWKLPPVSQIPAVQWQNSSCLSSHSMLNVLCSRFMTVK